MSNKNISEFRKRVYNVVRTIKSGQTLTYGEVARAIGSPQAARAVGTALGKNLDPAVPCHRVVRGDGKAGGYNRGTKQKLKLLKQEGVWL